jgi:hypothetical protein
MGTVALVGGDNIYDSTKAGNIGLDISPSNKNSFQLNA